MCLMSICSFSFSSCRILLSFLSCPLQSDSTCVWRDIDTFLSSSLTPLPWLLFAFLKTQPSGGIRQQLQALRAPSVSIALIERRSKGSRSGSPGSVATRGVNSTGGKTFGPSPSIYPPTHTHTHTIHTKHASLKTSSHMS